MCLRSPSHESLPLSMGSPDPPHTCPGVRHRSVSPHVVPTKVVVSHGEPCPTRSTTRQEPPPYPVVPPEGPPSLYSFSLCPSQDLVPSSDTLPNPHSFSCPTEISKHIGRVGVGSHPFRYPHTTPTTRPAHRTPEPSVLPLLEPKVRPQFSSERFRNSTRPGTR